MTYKIPVRCHVCRGRFWVEVPVEGFRDWWAGGKPIQDAMPELSISDRELLISKTCGHCFDKLFAEEGNEDAFPS